MKIINEENDRKKLYIQINDIINISHIYNLKLSFLEDIIKNNNMNNDFIEISNPDDIDLLNQFEFIVDYKKYKNISVDEYNSIYQEYIREISRLNKEMIYKRKKESINKILEQIDIISGQIKDIFVILLNKYNNKKINLPIVSDSDKDWYKVNNFIIKQSLDPNSIIIEANDDQVLNEKSLNKENIYLFYEIVRNKDNRINQNIYSNYTISYLDNKKVIITYNYNKKELNKELRKAKKI